MKHYQNEKYSLIFDRGKGNYSKLSIGNCEFNNCGISLSADIHERSKVTSIEIIDCKIINCAIGPVILNDVYISNIATGDLQIFWGSLFNRVKISGDVGRIKINTRIHAPDATINQQKMFDDFRIKFYNNVDWALDIADAKPQLLSITGVPSEKIIFDPNGCVALKRSLIDNLILDIAKSPSTPKDWGFAIKDFFDDTTVEELILVAPTGKRKNVVSPYLETVRLLRTLNSSV